MTWIVFFLFIKLKSSWLFIQISLAVNPLLHYDICNNRWLHQKCSLYGVRYSQKPIRRHNFILPLSNQFWTHICNNRWLHQKCSLYGVGYSQNPIRRHDFLLPLSKQFWTHGDFPTAFFTYWMSMGKYSTCITYYYENLSHMIFQSHTLVKCYKP